MQVQIKFIKSGSSSAFGSFEPGGLLRCSEGVARHFVEEVGVAKYVDAPVAAIPVEEVAAVVEPTVEAKPMKRTKAKAK